MKGKFIDVLKRSKKLRAGVVAAAVAVVIGSVGVYEIAQVPQMPVYTADPIVEVTIEEEEVPLAAKSTTTTKTSKKTSTKKKTLKKKSTRTYCKNLPTTSKTTTKTSKSKTKTVKKQTTIKTSVKEKYYKNKKYKNVTTTTVTTVKTTTTPVTKTTTSTTTAAAVAKYEVNVEKIAPKMNANVLQAFNTLGFKVYIDGSVNYSGYFDAKNRAITLKEEDDTIYHELGHFLAFISGNTDTTASFKNIYSAEKGKYTGVNKAYVIQTSSEYFAESVRDYILTPSSLQSARPQTYAAVTEAFGKVTTAQVNKLRIVYAAVWK